MFYANFVVTLNIKDMSRSWKIQGIDDEKFINNF